MTITNKISKIITAGLAALIMTTMAVPFAASAQTANTTDQAAASTCMDENARKELCDRRMSQYLDLCDIKKQITVYHDGLYHAKNFKIYGRKIRAVGYNGNFILGDWEVLDSTDSLHGGGVGQYKFNISGTYVAFALSFDVTWGTDFPFSGIFWNDIYNTNWENINITLDGTCRNVDVEFKIDNKKFTYTNCSAHKEWKP